MSQHTLPITHQPLSTLESWDRSDRIPALRVDNFRPESSSHHPNTCLKLAHDNFTLYGLFEVDDCYVRSVNTAFQSHTHRDTCVELFLQPNPTEGYFNFEWNCCGTLAVFYITDPTRIPDGFKAYQLLRPEDALGVAAQTTLHGIIDPEISDPIHWRLSFEINIAVLKRYTCLPERISGQTWRANAYKCGDETSHPHWAAWSPVPALNFHLPESFGLFHFA